MDNVLKDSCQRLHLSHALIMLLYLSGPHKSAIENQCSRWVGSADSMSAIVNSAKTGRCQSAKGRPRKSCAAFSLKRSFYYLAQPQQLGPYCSLHVSSTLQSRFAKLSTFLAMAPEAFAWIYANSCCHTLIDHGNSTVFHETLQVQSGRSFPWLSFSPSFGKSLVPNHHLP